MDTLKYTFEVEGTPHALELVFVEGTRGRSFMFGTDQSQHAVTVADFYIATVPVTQALWRHVMGWGTASASQGHERPAGCVSWDDITRADGFLNRINVSRVRTELLSGAGRFRLPSETEWEYAARGGQHWTDNFLYSGSNDVDRVAWYDWNSGREVKPVGLKAPNQLGLYDMSGNVWEWCQDHHTRDTNLIPKDGRPFTGDSPDRLLRGGCNHNWAIHCTVAKRYEIAHSYSDSNIGFRLVLSV